MAYSRYEQETSIVWDEDDKIARIYTASPVSIRKLDKLCTEHPDAYQRVWEEFDENCNVTAAKYETKCKLIRFAKPASEARKATSRANAQKMMQKRMEAKLSSLV